MLIHPKTHPMNPKQRCHHAHAAKPVQNRGYIGMMMMENEVESTIQSYGSR